LRDQDLVMYFNHFIHFCKATMTIAKSHLVGIICN
jgi:hypothetical protein